MKYCNFLPAAGLFTALLLHGALVFADDAILRISFIDNEAFVSNHIARQNEYLKQYYANRKLIQVSIPDDGHIDADVVRSKILEQLGLADRIRLLIIDTHGSTKTVGVEKLTSLSYIGQIFESAVDDQVQDIFNPIRGQVSSDVRIVLNSCNVFCGSKESAEARAESLLRYFNAPDGSIYGAVVPSVSIPSSYLTKDFIPSRDAFLDSLSLWGAITLVGAAITLPFEVFGYQLSPNPAAVASLVTLASPAITVGKGLLQPLLKKLGTDLGLINKGYLFEYQGGRLRSSNLVNSIRELNRIYGINFCQDLF